MTLFVVLIADRHTEPEPQVFAIREQAIAYARKRAEYYEIDPADDELGENLYDDGSCFMSIACTCEGDVIYVYAVELQAGP